MNLNRKLMLTTCIINCFGLAYLENSFGISSGSVLFTNLVLANATESYTNTLAIILTRTLKVASKLSFIRKCHMNDVSNTLLKFDGN